jgi:hypothetical protein
MIIIYGQLKSLKNSKQIFKNRKTGKSFITSSSAYKESLPHFIAQCLQNKAAFNKMLQNKEKPYKISFKFYRESHGRFDYINIVQQILDCMVSVGLLEDDDAKNVIPSFEPYEKDDIHPRTEIKVL